MHDMYNTYASQGDIKLLFCTYNSIHIYIYIYRLYGQFNCTHCTYSSYNVYTLVTQYIKHVTCIIYIYIHI